MRIRFTLLILLSVQTLYSQEILSGPMLGYCDLREVAVWVQTDDASEVSLRYWPQGSRQAARNSDMIRTTASQAFTAQLTCSLLEPGTTYSYEVVLDGNAVGSERTFTTQRLWQFREDPPEWNLVVGSCAYINESKYDRPGKPYGGNTKIFETIAVTEPDMMLWLGDNVYFREVDWNTRSGMIHRYSHMRALPELQNLLAACPHYAIWDDHDFGPNDSNSSWIHKDVAKEVFSLFWANPGYGTSELPGITTQFQFNDVDFFLLDNRWDRTDPDVQGIAPTILGKEQIEWLISALKDSNGRFKLVAMGGQFLSDFAMYENYALYPEERQEIINLIEANNIENVVFLSGDRHSSELTRLDLSNGEVIYDLTTSPLTSRAYDHSEESNSLRVEGSLINTQNFAQLNFSGPWENRKMTITMQNAEGDELWNHTIWQKPELKDVPHKKPAFELPRKTSKKK